MKKYLVYVDGVLWSHVKAGSLNAAEKKARAKIDKQFANDSGIVEFRNVSVEYTEE